MEERALRGMFTLENSGDVVARSNGLDQRGP